MVGSSLNFVGLHMLAASTYQILKTFMLVFVAILSVAFLGTRFDLSKQLALTIVLIGLLVVSIQSFDTDEVKSDNSAKVGEFCMILGQLCHAS